MKKTLTLALVLSQLIIYCEACNYSNVESNKLNLITQISVKKELDDSIVNLQLISRYKTGESEFFKTENEYPVSIFLYHKELFLLNFSDSKLIIINTEKKTTSTNDKINDIIKKIPLFGCNNVIFYINILRKLQNEKQSRKSQS